MEEYKTKEVGLDALSSSYKTQCGIGICFYDPVEEVLKEFNSNTKIPIYPMEEGYRRFYIVKDNITLPYNTISLRASTTSSDYTIKTVTDQNTDISQTPDNNVLIDFFSNHPNGIVPFYFYIKSNTTSYLDVEINIDLEVT